jgi:hypothetical protein
MGVLVAVVVAAAVLVVALAVVGGPGCQLIWWTNSNRLVGVIIKAIQGSIRH